MRPFLLLIILLLMGGAALAQSGSDTLSFRTDPFGVNYFGANLQKQLNTYFLNTRLDYNYTGERLFFSLKEDYISTLIVSRENNTKDDHEFDLKAGYFLLPGLQTGITTSNKILSDSRNIELNSAYKTSGAAYVKYSPDWNMYAAATAGYINDRQIGESDNGIAYGIEGMIDKEEISDFLVSGQFKFHNEDISPRKNTTRVLQGSFGNIFNRQLRNTFTGSFRQSGRDYYYRADSTTQEAFGITNNLQRRTETVYRIANDFTYNEALKNTVFQFSGEVYGRTINRDTRFQNTSSPASSLFDTRVEEFRFDLESSLHYADSRTSALLGLRYSERDEKHFAENIPGVNQIVYEDRLETEQRKNNLAKRTMLSLDLRYYLTKLDMIYFSASHSKLQYDTPSEMNFDDRDELLSIMKLRYIRNISPFFDFFLIAEANMNTISYLLAERSSNNNTNRVLKLNLGGWYDTGTITSYNSFEVGANYTNYEFEDLNPSFQSYSLRQLSLTDSTTWNITNRIALKFNGYFKEWEEGSFRWKEFTMSPSRRGEEVYLHPRFVSRTGRMLFGVGVRYFTLKTFRVREDSETMETDYRSIGPSTDIRYTVLYRVTLILSGWYEFISSNRASESERATLNFSLNWTF